MLHVKQSGMLSVGTKGQPLGMLHAELATPTQEQ